MESSSKNKWLIISIIIFVIYAAVTFIGASTHELWFDEAQAWTIARDNDIAGIIQMMKYEGHPPLWHFILHIFTEAGFRCEIMPFISWTFSAVTVLLILFRLPLSLTLRAALVFSGGLIYTNSVISRNYCLIPLLLCLIALVYPTRKSHPIIYGALVGLLALTHVAFSGIVGALGIFMLVDLFSDWKGNSVRQNIFNLCGLFIAGAGVILLVLPLLWSLKTNSVTAGSEYDIPSLICGILQSPADIAASGVSVPAAVTPFTALAAIIVQLCMLLIIILLRKRRRAFAALLISLAVYAAVGHGIFYVNPNRAAIVLFSFAFFICVAGCEKPAECRELKIKTDSEIIKSAFGMLSQCKISHCERLAAVMLALTIPSSAIYLVRDYTEQFCPVKEAAEFIESELPDDAVFVTESDILPQLSAYLPDVRLYSLEHGGFYTCTSHKIMEGDAPVSPNAYADLAACRNLYMINVYTSEHTADKDAVFSLNEGMKFSANILSIEIIPYNAENALIQNE